MANREIEIETNTLGSDIGELESELAEARGYIETMKSDMTQLDAMWEGPANEVFMMQFRNDAAYAEELCKMVENLTECMKYARKQYDACEAEVGSLVSSI